MDRRISENASIMLHATFKFHDPYFAKKILRDGRLCWTERFYWLSIPDCWMDRRISENASIMLHATFKFHDPYIFFDRRGAYASIERVFGALAPSPHERFIFVVKKSINMTKLHSDRFGRLWSDARSSCPRSNLFEPQGRDQIWLTCLTGFDSNCTSGCRPPRIVPKGSGSRYALESLRSLFLHTVRVSGRTLPTGLRIECFMMDSLAPARYKRVLGNRKSGDLRTCASFACILGSLWILADLSGIR